MTPAAQRLTAAVGTLGVLLFATVGLALAPAPSLSSAPHPAGAKSAARGGLAGVAASASTHPDEVSLLTDAQHDAYRFFQDNRAASASGTGTGTGRGLFETDFFKAPVTPPPPPKPPAPTRREVELFYRGLAAFPDGTRIAYLAFEGRTLTLALGEPVLDGWALAAFDSDQAVLTKGEERTVLPFNRRASLSVPLKP